MNWRAIFAITRKDLKVVSKTKAVVYPLILVPLIFVIFIPGLFGFILQDEAVIEEFTTEMSNFFENLPDGIRSEIDAYESDNQRILYLAIVYQLAPMFLILPLMVSSVIAADSFAGEKERIADSNIEQTRSSFKSRLRLIHLSKVGCSTDQNVRTLTEFAIRHWRHSFTRPRQMVKSILVRCCQLGFRRSL